MIVRKILRGVFYVVVAAAAVVVLADRAPAMAEHNVYTKKEGYGGCRIVHTRVRVNDGQQSAGWPFTNVSIRGRSRCALSPITVSVIVEQSWGRSVTAYTDHRGRFRVLLWFPDYLDRYMRIKVYTKRDRRPY